MATAILFVIENSHLDRGVMKICRDCSLGKHQIDCIVRRETDVPRSLFLPLEELLSHRGYSEC